MLFFTVQLKVKLACNLQGVEGSSTQLKRDIPYK